jgi:alkylated DNA repair dioxygenase AlkB
MQNILSDSNQTNSISNLLPKQGCINYYPELVSPIQCFSLYDQLKQSIDWQADQIFMFGKKIVTKRKVAWVADPTCSYTYSGVQKHPDPWTPELLLIKYQVEKVAGCTFNACLLNLYHNGSESMGWHSDDERELNANAAIASVSLGGTRKFAFKHKLDKTTHSLFLENGSALIMHPPTQQFWQHSLLKTKQPVAARINLTFRAIQPSQT